MKDHKPRFTFESVNRTRRHIEAIIELKVRQNLQGLTKHSNRHLVLVGQCLLIKQWSQSKKTLESAAANIIIFKSRLLAQGVLTPAEGRRVGTGHKRSCECTVCHDNEKLTEPLHTAAEIARLSNSPKP